MTVQRTDTPMPRMPEGWEPPVPSFTSRFANGSEAIVAAYLAAQGRSRVEALAGAAAIEGFLERGKEPYRIDRAVHRAGNGTWDAVAIAYFKGAAAFEAWANGSGFSQWWASDARLHEDVGYWQERLVLPQERIEALHSSPVADGHSHGGRIVGPIREHAYWGGMRDRLPVSRHDWLDSPKGNMLEARAGVASIGRRIRVKAPANLAIIRSGQDLSDAAADERAMYDEVVRGNLVAGMTYLAERGVEAGCCACRYMTEVDENGHDLERTFGHCLFLSLAHLEEWAKSHPTHLSIFASFFKLLKQRDNQMTLRFWHEVAVIPEDGQFFEYLNCSPDTGLIGFFDADEPALQGRNAMNITGMLT